MDEIDRKIIKILKVNSRLTNKEIGKQIHMTGQAVGIRITNLIERGIIKRFSIQTSTENHQFIRLFMNSNKFSVVEKFTNQNESIDEFYKVSGQACYQISAHFSNQELQIFLEKISYWARYSVETVIADKRR